MEKRGIWKRRRRADYLSLMMNAIGLFLRGVGGCTMVRPILPGVSKVEAMACWKAMMMRTEVAMGRVSSVRRRGGSMVGGGIWSSHEMSTEKAKEWGVFAEQIVLFENKEE